MLPGPASSSIRHPHHYECAAESSGRPDHLSRDLILTLPLLSALHRKYPDAQIDVLVQEGLGDVVEGHPAVNACTLLTNKAFTAV